MIPGIPEPDWADSLDNLPAGLADRLAEAAGAPGCGAQVTAELGRPAADRGPLGQFAARALAAAWAMDGAE